MAQLAIVIPVYDGLDHVERCLAALARFRPADSRVILIDDASPDPRVATALGRFARAHAAVEVLAFAENTGYIGAANAGARAAPAEADLLFLNSDTEITEGAIEEMLEVLHGDGSRAACCPLSNNATFLSVPRFQQASELPAGIDAAAVAGLVRASADARATDIPTPVGFCMLVRRRAWEAHGPFDAAFGRGYGEEDDFGQRLQAAGMTIACARRAFVYHRGGASFGATAGVADAKRENGKLLLSRWPHYAERVRAFCQANPMRAQHERLWHSLLSFPEARDAHVTHVVPRWEREGPLRSGMLALARATRHVANHTIVVPMPNRGAWLDAIDHEWERGVRVVGVIELGRRMSGLLRASPATLIHLHDEPPWMDDRMLRAVGEAGRQVLTLNPQGADYAELARAYLASARPPAG